MGKVVGPPIPERTKKFMEKQHIFFVGSAPLSGSGRINVSPKSAREFRIIDEKTVGYIDLTGSGSETTAHLMENKRIVIMFVAFTGPPAICRLHGRGKVLTPEIVRLPGNAHLVKPFEGLLPGQENAHLGFRSIIVVNVERVSDSCGYSIPFYDYVKERRTLDEVTGKMGSVNDYHLLKNSFSIDGLRSYAQLRYGNIPSSQHNQDGFLWAKYEDKGVFRNFVNKLIVVLKMLYAGGLHRLRRDVLMTALGAIAALVIMKSRGR